MDQVLGHLVSVENLCWPISILLQQQIALQVMKARVYSLHFLTSPHFVWLCFLQCDLFHFASLSDVSGRVYHSLSSYLKNLISVKLTIL
ncbi:hypothetical protein LINGRAHAP2_LOCUS5550, partial [Linum grandiflorum]